LLWKNPENSLRRESKISENSAMAKIGKI